MVQQMQTTCQNCKGAGKMMEEKDKCKACKGSKVFKDRKVLEVNLEKGMQHGQKIRFSGEADDILGTIAGDVIIVVQEKEHETFKRKGGDLIVDFEISLTEALCGFTRTLTHLDNRVLKIEVPAGTVTMHDSVKLIKGEGMPQHGNIFNKGGLFVHFKVKFPKTLPESTVNKLKALRPAPSAPMLTGEEEEVTRGAFDLSRFGRTTAAGRSAVDDDDDDGGHGGAQRVQCGQN